VQVTHGEELHEPTIATIRGARTLPYIGRLAELARHRIHEAQRRQGCSARMRPIGPEAAWRAAP
jgi:hypothetical protein